MQSVRITLYEVFGYVVPGALALIAAVVATWGFYYPNSTLPIVAPHYNIVILGSLLLLAYLAGHVLQAVGNMCFSKAEDRSHLVSGCKVLADLAKQQLQDTYKNTAKLPTFRDVVSLSNAVLSQIGKGDEYELYVYREGFYRGASIGALLCGVASLIRVLHPPTIELLSRQITIPTSLPFIAALLCFFTCWLFYARFKRFGEYRVRYLLSAVTIVLTPPRSDQSEKED